MGCPVPAYAANYSASSFYNLFLLAAQPFRTHSIRIRVTLPLSSAVCHQPLFLLSSLFLDTAGNDSLLQRGTIPLSISRHSRSTQEAFSVSSCFLPPLHLQADSYAGLVTSADIGRNRAAPVTCDASSRIRCHYVFCFFINAFGRSRNHFPLQR